MINQINLEYLKVFYEVAKHKSVSKAASALMISQPAITQTLNKLEEGLGATLLIRNNKGVSITFVGQQVFEQVSKMMSTLNAIDKIVLEEKELLSGKILIGCSTNIARKLLTQPIKNFHAKFPYVSIQIIDDVQTRFLEQIKDNQMDMCIIQRSEQIPSDMIFKPLIQENFVFVASPNLGLGKNLKSYETQTFLVQNQTTHSRKVFDDFCEETNFHPNKIIEAVGYNLCIEFALQEVGIAMVPNYLVEEYLEKQKLVLVPILLNNPVMEYGYCINSQYHSKALKEFLNFF